MNKCGLLGTPSLLVLFLIAGCGPPVNPNAPANLKGRVSYKGNAITAGTIALNDGQQNVKVGQISSDGTYYLSDIPTGDYTVAIETDSANRKKETYGAGQGGKDKKGGGMSPVPEGANVGAAGSYTKIPQQYGDGLKSPLKVTLTRGNNAKDFDLTD